MNIKKTPNAARAYRERLERPKFWIVAGANGSGKSSAYADAEIDDTGGAVWIINPDILTARIQVEEGLDLLSANVEAAERIQRWLNVSIDTYQTIGVETVLSTDKYRSLVLAAKRRGFEIHLIYVVLKTVELNIARVALRVRNGGHDVPRHKIIERRQRSFEQLPWFFAHADRALVYDNSNTPRKIVEKRGGKISITSHNIVELHEALARARSIDVPDIA